MGKLAGLECNRAGCTGSHYDTEKPRPESLIRTLPASPGEGQPVADFAGIDSQRRSRIFRPWISSRRPLRRAINENSEAEFTSFGKLEEQAAAVVQSIGKKASPVQH
jgi:hypothetical protein